MSDPSVTPEPTAVTPPTLSDLRAWALERAKWEPPLSSYLLAVAGLCGEVEALRAALLPFAAYDELRGCEMPDETLMDSVLPNGPTLGDCRRAAEALNPGQGGGDA